MKQKYSILLAVISQHKILYKNCIPNYKYVSIKNNIAYNHKIYYNFHDLLNNNYEIILLMNHHCVFMQNNIDDIIEELEYDNTNIILPKDINMPMQLIPMLIKNCEWSKKFLKLYLQSATNNLKQFIEMYSFRDCKYINYTDRIDQSSKTLLSKNCIIKQFIELSTPSAAEKISYINTRMGIVL